MHYIRAKCLDVWPFRCVDHESKKMKNAFKKLSCFCGSSHASLSSVTLYSCAFTHFIPLSRSFSQRRINIRESYFFSPYNSQRVSKHIFEKERLKTGMASHWNCFSHIIHASVLYATLHSMITVASVSSYICRFLFANSLIFVTFLFAHWTIRKRNDFSFWQTIGGRMSAIWVGVNYACILCEPRTGNNKKKSVVNKHSFWLLFGERTKICGRANLFKFKEIYNMKYILSHTWKQCSNRRKKN